MTASRRLAPWLLAFGAYTAVYAMAFRLSPRVGPLDAAIGALCNSLPDALAAPLAVLGARRLVSARSPGRVASLALGGVLFIAWSIGLWALLITTHRWSTSGVFRVALEPSLVVWKGIMSLLVFGILCGVGLAGAYEEAAREATERAARAETLRAEARLAILRAQLNPHFVLNVLHSLAGLTGRDPAAAATALERLGTVLRYGLRVQGEGIDRVRLGEELDFVKETLELERLRLGDRLRVEMRVDDSLLGAEAPPFVLQPLVENAVRHAIAPRAGGGLVRVAVHREGNRLALDVEDDGDAEVQPRSPGGAGLGLRLLRDRLEALYGPRATLETGRTPEGFRARVRLPLAPEDEETA